MIHYVKHEILFLKKRNSDPMSNSEIQSEDRYKSEIFSLPSKKNGTVSNSRDELRVTFVNYHSILQS